MIQLKTDKEILEMRKAGELTYELLDLVASMIKPGISTQEINDVVHEETIRQGAYPGTLGYRGFKHSCCTSVNDVICHGIPDPNHILKDGDVVNVDISPRLNGWYGDSSKMFLVGNVAPNAVDLIGCMNDALHNAIDSVEVGKLINSIGKAVETTVNGTGYSIVEDFVGHGIGRRFHEHPPIAHHFSPTTTQFRKGMVFTIEPMINEGTKEWYMLDDGWTVKTLDKMLSVQAEHTIAINSKGDVEIISCP